MKVEKFVFKLIYFYTPISFWELFIIPEWNLKLYIYFYFSFHIIFGRRFKDPEQNYQDKTKFFMDEEIDIASSDRLFLSSKTIRIRRKKIQHVFIHFEFFMDKEIDIASSDHPFLNNIFIDISLHASSKSKYVERVGNAANLLFG